VTSAPTAVLPALLRASHPGPTLAVTLVATALAWGAGATTARLLAVLLAVLAGQLTIGWTNDAHDAERDVDAGREDKPIATGEVSASTVRRAAQAAGAGCVVVSLALGPPAAAVHLLGVVGSGLVYDLLLKTTRWSWLPFAVAFGLLPAVATLAAPGQDWPPLWAMAAGALLGVAAHLVNALPDLDDDERLGVHGFPQWVGPRSTRALTGVALVAATTCLVVGPARQTGEGVGPAGWVLLGVSVGTAAAALGRRWPVRSRTPFVLVAGLAVLDVVVLVAEGVRLT
jgi:4-hydroxybenzoate polyprenyltransferase